jgi:uncharacterized membrane protein
MSVNPRSTVKIAGHPLHPILVTLPIGLWVGALLTDIAYVWTGWSDFAYFSSWLIGAGIGTAVLAATAGLIDFMGEARIRALRKAWYHMFGNVAALVLAIVNFMFHLRDGAAAVLPEGIVLSAVVVVLLLFNGWMGGELVFRHRVGVRDVADREFDR